MSKYIAIIGLGYVGVPLIHICSLSLTRTTGRL
jgi:UDP-N-acetyl-D-mannosaminuronate dehydrogenase